MQYVALHDINMGYALLAKHSSCCWSILRINFLHEKSNGENKFVPGWFDQLGILVLEPGPYSLLLVPLWKCIVVFTTQML